MNLSVLKPTFSRYDGQAYHSDGRNHVSFRCPRCDGHFLSTPIDEEETSPVIDAAKCGKWQIIRGEVGQVP